MERIDRLTSVRGIAALYVVLFHCEATIRGLHLEAWTGFAGKGYLAVDFFFVLSGFILAHVYAGDSDAGRLGVSRFLALRLGRVYPVHLATLCLAAVIAASPGFSQDFWLVNSPHSVLSNLFLVHSWGLHEGMSWNFVSWSISAEWFAYLGFPLYILVSRWFIGRPFAASCAALLLLVLLGSIVFLAMPRDVLPNPVQPLGMLRVSCEFLAGVLLLRAYRSLALQPRRWAGPMAAALVTSLIVILHLEWPGAVVLQDTLAIACMAGAIICLALDTRLLGRLLEWRPLVALGEASYSIYMAHGLYFLAYLAAIDAGLLAHTDTRSAALQVAAVLSGLSIASGFAVYRWFELPTRKITRRWIDHAGAAQGAAQAQRS